jgi:hypothetical protein
MVTAEMLRDSQILLRIQTEGFFSKKARTDLLTQKHSFYIVTDAL